MNFYNKPKIEWDEIDQFMFMGTYIWIYESKKLSGTVYTGVQSLDVDDDSVIFFTEPFTDKEKCREAIENKCQELIVRYTVGLGFENAATPLKAVLKQGHITEREASK